MTTVLIAGEINVDLICAGYSQFPQLGKEVTIQDFALTLGSSSAICAMGLAKLGVAVRYVGKVGADRWGEYCVETMHAAGIDVSRIHADRNLSTGVTIAISSQRDRALMSYLGASSALRAEDVTDEALDGVDHLHISSYFLQQGLHDKCGDLLDRATRTGATVSLDPGYDPAESWDSGLRSVLRGVDLFFPNEVELKAISRASEVREGLRALGNGRTRTVVTLGASGSATVENGDLLRVPAAPIAVVDSTGAGDSFNAGFLHAWLRKLPIVDCLRWGAANGALCSRSLGGTSSQGTLAELQTLLASWQTA